MIRIVFFSLILIVAVTSPGAGAAEKAFQIDRFGQFADLDYPEKVRQEEELRADAVREEAYYQSFPLPERSFWGGLPGSKEKYGLTATGFFHLEQVAALRGRTVEPEGNLYFHLGVCSMMPGNEFTRVKGRESIYEWLPTIHSDYEPARWGDCASFYLANWIRKYGSYDEIQWQRTMVERLRRWGFNGFGEFTQVFPGNDQLGFAFTKCLEHYWKREKFTLVAPKFIDPFAEDTAALLEKVFADRTKPYRDHPALIGYYTENETDYPAMIKALLELREPIPAKREFARLMAKRYRNRIADFNRNWQSSFSSFDQLAAAPLKTAGKESQKDAAAFEAHYFDTLFALLARTLKKVDPNHLYLGERILPGQIRNDLVIRTLGKYCDVFSANYYTDGYLPAEVDHLARVSGRPILLSEWSFGSPDQGLFGVRNVSDQTERAAQYRRYVENAAASVQVVGVQWFCLLDESNTGRGWNNFHGERFNTGLLNVCDRPYRELVEAAAHSNRLVYDFIEGKIQPVATPSYQVMYAGNRVVSVGRIKQGGRLDGDPGKYGTHSVEPLYQSIFKKGFTDQQWGEFRFGWDETYFYCWVRMPDRTPAMNRRAGNITDDDSLELFLGSDAAVPGRMLPHDRQLVIRVNQEDRPEFAWFNNGVKLPAGESPLSVCLVTRERNAFVMEVAVPWREIHFVPVAGERIRFDLLVNIGGRTPGRLTERIVYNGLAENNQRRDIWAIGVLE